MQRIRKYRLRETPKIIGAFLLATSFGISTAVILPEGVAQEPVRRHSRHYIDADVHRPAETAPLPPTVSLEQAKTVQVSVLMPLKIDDWTETISIAELQALAETHNPTLRIIKHQIGAAQGAQYQAGRKPNPTLAYEAEEIGDGGKAGKHGVVIEQEIQTGGKRKLERSIAAWETDARRKELRLRFASIQNDVKARAYELLAAQQIAEIQATLADIGRKSMAAADELVKAGETSRIDLLQIRAKARESEAALKKARIDEELAWKKVATMIGQRELPKSRIVDSLEVDGFYEDRETAWQVLESQSPKLAMARSRIQQARTALARERAGQVPDIAVSGGIHYDFAEKQTLGSIGVGVPLQIFDRNEGNIRKAQGELAAACGELNRLTTVLYEEFCEFFSTLEATRGQVDLYREHILPDVREALELSLKGYRQGEYGYMDVLSAQQAFLESQTQYVELLKNRALATVYLDGFLATGGLDETEN